MQSLGTAMFMIAMVFAFSRFADSAASGAEKPRVVLETSMGSITFELAAEEAPLTTENFLSYVDKGFYDNTVFHRVIGPNARQPQGFMVQGGGFEAGSPIREKETGQAIKNEAANGLSNERGTIAMARTSDPDSATSQFFINLSNNTFLDRTGDAPGQYGYTVFGRVVEGMDVVDRIARVDTGRANVLARDSENQLGRAVLDDVPTEPVIIESVRRSSE